MSHWNHRVVKKTIGGVEFFGVHEAFYNDSGELVAYTVDPVDIAGDSIDDIREYLQWCLDCLDKPVLIDGEVKFAKDDWDKVPV